MGGDFSDSMLLFPVSSIDAFYSSGLRVVYFCMMRPSSSGSGISILIIFTTSPLDIGFKVLSFLALYLLFSMVRSAWSLDSSLELPMAAIFLNISSR